MNPLQPNTALILLLVTSLVIPLVSELLSKAHWSEQATGLITMLLAAVGGFCTEWSQSPNMDHYDWKTAAGAALLAFVIAVAAHYGVWKGGSLAAKLRTVGPGGAPAGQHEQAGV